jgi:GntR family transcriptional repressor for pyruvate dehydrogenase complex
MKDITFGRIKNRRLSEFIESSIRDLILNGEIGPGDKLPPERDISQQFGVSVVTVREALRGLEAFGMIEKKKGKGGGIFVSEVTSDSVKNALQTFLLSRKFSVNHLSQVRMIIEPPAVKIAALEMDSDGLTEMEKNIRYCERSIEKAGSSFSDKDFFDIEERNVEFHRLIGESSRNPILALTIDYVMDFLFSMKKTLLDADRAFSVEVVDDHRQILSCLKERDPVKAEQAMTRHLHGVDNYLGDRNGSDSTLKRRALNRSIASVR